MLRRAYLLVVLAALAGVPVRTPAMQAAPGDTSSVVLLSANFDTDTAGLPPDVTLPAPPPGDYLTLDQSGGSTLVQSSVDGLSYPVLIRQENTPLPVAVQAWLAPRAAGLERMTVRWRSLARDDNPVFLFTCALRSPSGGVIASVNYNPHSDLSYNGASGVGATLPVAYVQNRNQQFTIQADFKTQTTSLAIDGVPVPGFQAVPFVQPATDLARVGFEVGPSHPQTFAVDEISAVAFFRTPDNAPVVTAPASAGGAEGSLLHFGVTAADPDGQAITSLTAAPLPAGAVFTPDASNASGAFDWTPGYDQAGAYSVTFTAANTLVGTAATAISIAATDRAPVVTAPPAKDGEEGGTLIFTVTAADPDGDPITSFNADLSLLPSGNDATFTPGPGNLSGTFVWHMRIGDGGSYPVTFTASNALTGVAYTRINVAASGTSVTGELIWTPEPGMEGLYNVTFTAVNTLGEASTAVTQVEVFPAGSGAVSAPARGGPAEAPRTAEAPQKGPIIYAPSYASTTVGTTLTVDATATSSGTALLARALPARAPARAMDALTLTADLTPLPPGNNAVFLVDRDPVLSAPAQVSAQVETAFSFGVSVSDPDTDPIYSLAADLSGLPSGSGATFGVNGTNTFGVFAWSPAIADSGNYSVAFTAFNALVAHATTAIRVEGVAQASGYSVDKIIKLQTNKPTVCTVIQPLDNSFRVEHVLLSTVRLVSPGTGAVSEIPASGKMAIAGDRNKDGIPDLTICFLKGDVRSLFSLLRGKATVPVTLEGQLLTGRRFVASFTVTVQAGGGAMQASISPNPLNPSARLNFYTTRPGPLRVRVYDLGGRLVRELADVSFAPAGEHELTLDGRDMRGRPLASGVYYYRIEAAEETSAGRFTVLK